MSSSFAELLRRHRLAANLTQRDLAERAGVSVEAISALERGFRRLPRRDTVNLLAGALRLGEAERVALAGAVRRPHDVEPPSAALGLIGRDEELGAACTLLKQETRLLTLTGPPGVGKTRLGLAVAGELNAEFPSGVLAVDLAPLADPRLMSAAIRQALGMADSDHRIGVQDLVESIGRRRLLLVLDNFEHVLETGPLLTELLAGCPGLHLLVTSRAALHLRDEQELPVPALRPAHAVALFVERARACSPSFRLSPDNERAVAEICQRLEGLPLALELAARWVKLMGPDALLARLRSRLDMLVDGAHDLPNRQRTMRAALEWSYRLLEPEEQLLFRQLSMFVGGATLDAVEAICGQAVGGHVLGLAARLVDRSLLLRQHGNGRTDARITMLDTMREYGHELLAASAERETTARAHAHYYLELARRAEPELTGRRQATWLERLELDHHNLRAALRWLHERNEVDQGLELAARLWRFWEFCGYVREGREWLACWLDRDPGDRADIRALALRAAAVLAWHQSDLVTSRARCDESLRLYRAMGDTGGIDAALNNMAAMAWQQGDLEQAIELWRSSLVLLGEEPSTPEVDDMREQAQSVLIELARVRRRRGDRHRLALTLATLSDIAQSLGQLNRAERALEECLDVCRENGALWLATVILNHLGDIARAQSELARAEARYRTSFDMRRNLAPSSTAAMHCIEGLAAVAAMRGMAELAARLYGAAAPPRDAICICTSQRPSVRLEHDRIIAQLRRELGAERFLAAWAAGQALSLDKAAAEARQPTDQPRTRRRSPRAQRASNWRVRGTKP